MIYVLFKSINQTPCHPVPSGKESRSRQSLLLPLGLEEGDSNIYRATHHDPFLSRDIL